MSRILLLFAFLVGLTSLVEAQTSLNGKVKDEEGLVAIGAVVRIFKDGVEKGGITTDDFGNFNFSPIDPGTYDMRVTYVGAAEYMLTGIVVVNGRANKVPDILLEPEDRVLEGLVIKSYKVPLIEQDNTSQQTTLTAENIAKAPVRTIDGLVAATGGASNTNGSAVSLRGSRTNATNYYIDGIRVSSGYLPPNEVEQLQIVTGGIEAQYGDVIGGVIVATTKGPSNQFTMYVDGETSKFLDPWERSEGNLSISGPILKNKEGRAIIGYRLGGRVLYSLDDDPSYAPIRYMKADAIERIKQNPVLGFSNGVNFPAGEFNLTENSEFSKIRKNQSQTNYDFNGKLDFRLSKSMDIQIGAGYTDRQDYFNPDGDRKFEFANSENNPLFYQNRIRGNFRFRHRLSNDAGNKGLLQNVSYTITGGYEKTKELREDIRHKGNLFDYGYIGKFNLNLVPLFEPDTIPGKLKQMPSLVGLQEGPYQPGTQNPVLAAYNSVLDTSLAGNPNAYFVQNGFAPSFFQDLYSLYNNVGTIYNNFQKSEDDVYSGRFDISFDLVSANSDKGAHNINMGFLYEQQVNRFYRILPRALWQLAGNLANEHLDSIDLNNPTGDTLFIDGFDPLPLNHMYPGEVVGGKFYKSIREKLGVPLYEVVFTNNLTPADLSLDMFSANELASANIINFYGYDYLGNKVGNASFNEFFTRTVPGLNNVREMLLAPNRPIYQSFYIQDKFRARDVIFRLGLRVESFDANTKVMKDPYSLYEIVNAEEYYNIIGEQRPSNINPNAAVYLNSAGTLDGGVKGFRVGDTWYNAAGAQVSDPNVLFNFGVPNPYYKLRNDEVVKPSIDLASYDPDRSFRDYDPQVSFSPRIAISFPISDDANFFGHYDVLVQRPTGNYASGLDFLQWESRTEFNNPDLKPEKNIDYEIGFQQKLNNTSALKLSVYYKEIRDLIQRSLLTYTSNTSGSMLTFRNIDFSTVKGLQVQYDLRRTANLSLLATYNLQFAEGTGSDVNTQRNIARNGQVRVLSPLDFDERHALKMVLDYRFTEGKSYNGPVLFGLDILSNAGVNVIGTVISGRPYTRQTVPTQFGGSGNTGTYNGSRYPWNYNFDMRIDKSFALTAKDAKRPINMNVYLRISNLLNTRNVYNLYKASGSAYDDGYLNTQQGQLTIPDDSIYPLIAAMGRNSTEYINAYNWLMYNPDFFSGPRRFFIGANFNF